MPRHAPVARCTQCSLGSLFGPPAGVIPEQIPLSSLAHHRLQSISRRQANGDPPVVQDFSEPGGLRLL